MNRPAVAPVSGRAPAVSSGTLQRWLQRGRDDDGRPLLLLDTRNAFEVDAGSFDGALDWRLRRFSEFPDALQRHVDALRGKAVVSYCTGGIRCEKATLVLREAGVHAYQLDGGILNYFEQHRRRGARLARPLRGLRPPRQSRHRPASRGVACPMSRWLRRAIGLLLMATALALALSRAPDLPVQALVARWAPAPSDFIDLHGQLVHLRDEGPRNDPLPIVLVHGTSASLHTWQGWAAALRAQRRVITFDLPAFGLTGPFAGRYAGQTYRGDEYARFVLDLMDALGVQRAVLGGNSLGGEVAWRVASLAPQRVERLILVDAAGYAFEPASIPIGFMLARVPVLNRLTEWLLPRGVVEASVRDVYGDAGKVTSALVDRYFELTLREGNRRALLQRFQAMRRDAEAYDDNRVRIRALKLPVLILWGGRDRLIPPAIANQFNADIAGSRLVVFDRLGHVPHDEDPTATAAVVREFVATP